MANKKDYNARFGGIGRLYGEKELEHLQKAHVMIIGLGGVGSWSVEALARSGIGRLTLVDLDDICLNNVNRQLPAHDGNIGRLKTEALMSRVKTIQPSCLVRSIEDFYTAETSSSILIDTIDVVIDAIDDVKNKIHLIEECHRRKLPIIVCGGAGGRRDASKLEIDDLSRGKGDPLLRRVRRSLRKNGFSSTKRWKIPAIFSQERPVFPTLDGGVCETRSTEKTLRLDCQSGFGSAVFVTGTMGFLAAQLAVELIVNSRHIIDQ